MALTFSNVNTAISIAAGATLAVGSITAAVGESLVVMVAADNAGTSGVASLSSTITDSVGNTYVLQFITTQVGGAVAGGVTLAVWVAEITTAITNGTITTSYSPNTTAKAITVKKIAAAAGFKPSVVTVGTAAAGSATTSTITLSVTDGDTILGVTGVEQSTLGTADSDTTNGTWSTAYTALASTGTNTTSITLSSQQKTVTATGNQTYNLNYGGTARDYVINAIVFTEIAAALSEYWSINGVTM
jgi:peptidoglycan DL-endopeptidase CwlO